MAKQHGPIWAPWIADCGKPGACDWCDMIESANPYPDDEVTEEIPDIEAHNAALLADHERANR